MDKNELQNLGTPLSIVIAGALVAAAVYFSGAGTGVAPVTGNNQPAAPVVDSNKVDTTGDPYIGNANAPLTVVEFFDYQCPFCKQVEHDVLPNLIRDYVKTGKVKVVYKDFQFLGQDSFTAGAAARAIWEQAPDKFEAWHEAMFVKQDAENGGWGNKADVLALAKSVGIDTAALDKLMTSKGAEYQKEMDADRAEGAKLGVTGTPAFIIGTQVVAGAQSYDVVKAAVDAALK